MTQPDRFAVIRFGICHQHLSTQCRVRLNREALVYRLRGQGFPTVPRGPRGDYLVRVTPVFPAQDDPAQEALLDQLIARANQSAEGGTGPLGQWAQRMGAWTAGQQAA